MAKSILYKAFGKEQTREEWAKEYNISPTALWCRFKKRKDISLCLEPIRITKKYSAFGESKTISDWYNDSRCIVGLGTLRDRIENLEDSSNIENCLILKDKRKILDTGKKHNYKNELKTLRQLSLLPECKVSFETLRARITGKKWNAEKAVNTARLKTDTKEYIGKIFGNVYVIDLLYKEKDLSPMALCLCGYKECYNIFTARIGSIIGENGTDSCTCKRDDKATRHGLYKHIIYKLWVALNTRCYNENIQDFECWGGRGIYVCEEWIRRKGNDKFLNFFQWAQDKAKQQGIPWDDILNKKNGKKRMYSIERINIDGPYSPENCEWGTYSEQSINRRFGKYYQKIIDKQKLEIEQLKKQLK